MTNVEDGGVPQTQRDLITALEHGYTRGAHLIYEAIHKAMIADRNESVPLSREQIEKSFTLNMLNLHSTVPYADECTMRFSSGPHTSDWFIRVRRDYHVLSAVRGD